jgi:hypothetical protein
MESLEAVISIGSEAVIKGNAFLTSRESDSERIQKLIRNTIQKEVQ